MTLEGLVITVALEYNGCQGCAEPLGPTLVYMQKPSKSSD